MKKITDLLPGQSSIEPEELEQLIPSHLTFKAELNEFEEVNVSKAVQKYLMSTRTKWDLTSPDLIKKIHKDMFDATWEWTGKYRLSGKNIGVSWEQISTNVKNTCDNLVFWIADKTYSDEEIAVRLHYQLVWIHPFPNGNGLLKRTRLAILI